MEKMEALKGCVKVLEGMKVPVGLLEEVAVPARAVANTLRDVVAALDREQGEQKK